MVRTYLCLFQGSPKKSLSNVRDPLLRDGHLPAVQHAGARRVALALPRAAVALAAAPRPARPAAHRAVRGPRACVRRGKWGGGL